MCGIIPTHMKMKHISNSVTRNRKLCKPRGVQRKSHCFWGSTACCPLPSLTCLLFLSSGKDRAYRRNNRVRKRYATCYQMQELTTTRNNAINNVWSKEREQPGRMSQICAAKLPLFLTSIPPHFTSSTISNAYSPYFIIAQISHPYIMRYLKAPKIS